MKFSVYAVIVSLAVTLASPAAADDSVNVQPEFAFTDVSSANTHSQAIYRAYDLGIMSGYPDGEFGPNESLSRGHVVKALGKYMLGLQGKAITEVSKHGFPHLTKFNDVPDGRDEELYKYSLIVKDAGIFEGSNNNLMPNNLITRQQMAKVLVNAFGLKDQEGVTSKVQDKNFSFSYFHEYIDILSENNVTTEKNFRPLEHTTRGQFASFLTRAYDATDQKIAIPYPVVAVNKANSYEIANALSTFNTVSYLDTLIIDQYQVSQFFYESYSETDFKTRAEVVHALKTSIEVHAKLLSAVNNATTTEEMIDAIEGLKFDPFVIPRTPESKLLIIGGFFDWFNKKRMEEDFYFNTFHEVYSSYMEVTGSLPNDT